MPAVLLAAVLSAGPIFAAGKGQDDFDKATQLKLSANTISDLGEVIRLTESALDKGLDESTAAFAKKVLASTLIQRAQMTSHYGLQGVATLEEIRQRRQFALRDLEKAVKLDPKQPEAFVMIAELSLLPGGAGPKKARAALDKAIELGGDDPALQAKALLLRAELDLLPEGGGQKMARAALDKAIELGGDDPAIQAKAYMLRADVQEKPEKSLADLNQAITLAPDDVEMLLMRARVYQDLGEKQKALADADRALKLQPGLPDAVRTRAWLLAESDRLDEAVGELEALAQREPKDVQTLMQLALLYSVRKDSAKAIDAYTSVLAIDPEQWEALRGRGNVYLNVGKQAEALADYEQVVKLNRQDETLLNNLAWLLATSPEAKLRDGRRAVKLATEACKLTDYKAAYILSTLAAAYAETGDFPSAIKWSTKAVELSDRQERADLKKELASYQAHKPWRELLSEQAPPAPKPAAKK